MARRIISLVFGLYLYGLGLTFLVYNGLGVDAWNVFHGGMAARFGISLGSAYVVTSVIFMVIALLLGEPIGIGTLGNAVLIGVFMQFHMNLGIFTTMTTPLGSGAFLVIGLTIVGFATYFYMAPQLGAGPRDSFYVAICKRTGLQMGYAKIIAETVVVILGIFLGGSFGIGTIIGALSGGLFVQLAFKLFHFDARTVHHESLTESLGKLHEHKL
ncbi:hypothetical protein O6R05_00515 [Peptoniphilus equinus]|uniref:Membrane protein YczE n=1 Tax=Peptoniphilus equinus TaxID=3016343 RepID=A0ABY7QV66_9FIRM|nr:hypothetical protein [Peptoniphilus equinus]WBW50078.1 hypothetical protein O6R05_00515 [Peptoniphilus equinus]